MWGKKHFSAIMSVLGLITFITLSFNGCINRQQTVGGTGSNIPKGNTPLYYDFGDILLPSELKIDKKETYIIEGPGFLTGILKLKGKVERTSLIIFFRNNMAKDNWKSISSFKTPNKAILLFQKKMRWCIINITETQYSTYVEVGVAPSIVEKSESDLM
ncbi:hypothetical protein QUF75_19565 [Desulfococcaceae bacterium HSG7]|nr:hypothetical protein [Desulfococcaceae bacterium HSG9]MDM8556931.1 hypothetical protein [Desulfococcaceae bacterium HSG7]